MYNKEESVNVCVFFFLPAVTKIEMRKVSILLDVVVEAFIQHLAMIKVSANIFQQSHSHLHQNSHVSKVVIHLVASREVTEGY